MGTGRARLRRPWPRPPLWLRWVLSIVVAAALLLALVRFVQGHSSSAQTADLPAATAQENREVAILVAQDQAPHVLRLKAGVAPAAAIERAVHAQIATEIAHAELDGPVTHSSCAPVGPRGGSGLDFRCTVTAADVNYQFLGVVDDGRREVTYCKRDPPPVPSENIPVSRRCLA